MTETLYALSKTALAMRDEPDMAGVDLRTSVEGYRLNVLLRLGKEARTVVFDSEWAFLARLDSNPYEDFLRHLLATAKLMRTGGLVVGVAGKWRKFGRVA